MKLQNWTNKSLEKYCQFILGYSIKVIYIPISITNATMIAYPKYNVIVRSLNKFPRALVWHECGHIDSARIFRSFINSISKKLIITAKDIKNELEQCQYYQIKQEKCKTKKDKNEFFQFAEDEANAHLWGYEQAVIRKYPYIAQEIIDVMDYMNFDKYDIYKEAKNKILKQKILIDKKYLI